MTVRPRDALIKMEDVFTSRLQRGSGIARPDRALKLDAICGAIYRCIVFGCIPSTEIHSRL